VNSAFIIIDAIDELPDVNEHGEDTRNALLDILRTPNQKYDLFLTSRPRIRIPARYGLVASLVIEAKPEALKLFSKSKITRSKRLASFIKTGDRLEAEITSAITQKASGI
jgi:hypothetical protein